MNRLFALAVALFLFLGLFAACSQSDNPADPVSMDVSADQKAAGDDPVLPGDPSASDLYCYQVYLSIADRPAEEWVEIEMVLNQSFNGYTFTHEAYEGMEFRLEVIDPDGPMLGGPMEETVITLWVPRKPPVEAGDDNFGGDQYLDIFQNNLIYKISELPDASVANFILTVPIAPWNNPAGLKRTMFAYAIGGNDDNDFNSFYNKAPTVLPEDLSYATIVNPGRAQGGDENSTIIGPPIPVVVSGGDPDKKP